MRKAVLVCLVAFGCGGSTHSGTVSMPEPVDSGSAAGGGAGGGGDSAAADVAAEVDSGAGQAPVIDTVAPDAQGESDLVPASDMAMPAPADAGPDATPRPLHNCADDPSLACGPRNERFPWACIGMLCTNQIRLPAACEAYGSWLLCDCDMPALPGDSVSKCAAGGPSMGQSTYTVRTSIGVACRMDNDCFGWRTKAQVCGVGGVCLLTTLQHCATGTDCVTGMCNSTSLCVEPAGSACLYNAYCYSGHCEGNTCR